MKTADLIREGENLLAVSDFIELKNKYAAWCSKVRIFMKEGYEAGECDAVNVKMHYSENGYSTEDTIISIKKAAQDTITYLTEMDDFSAVEFSKPMAAMLIDRVLNDFGLFYRTLFVNPVHKRGTLTQEMLNLIKVGNEHDLQRMLCALLSAIFPAIRQEVNEDNGYGGMRADLYLDEFDIIIETKCTRNSMTEKQLIEEIGADAFYYQASMVFFYIYDKNKIIKNPAALKNALEAKRNEKTIKVIIHQPF